MRVFDIVRLQQQYGTIQENFRLLIAVLATTGVVDKYASTASFGMNGN